MYVCVYIWVYAGKDVYLHIRISEIAWKYLHSWAVSKQSTLQFGKIFVSYTFMICYKFQYYFKNKYSLVIRKKSSVIYTYNFTYRLQFKIHIYILWVGSNVSSSCIWISYMHTYVCTYIQILFAIIHSVFFYAFIWSDFK